MAAGTTRLNTETAGTGPPLVLVHGFTQTLRSWDHVAGLLRKSFTVTTVDAPGHGGSDRVRLDMADAARLLVEQCGEATYVGYSMGGRLCLQAALARPDAVQALVLLSGSPGIADHAERAARKAADDLLADAIERDGVDDFLDRWLVQPMFARLPHDPADLANRRRNSAGGLASSLRLAGTGAQESLWDRLSDLQMPVLIVTGDHDLKFTTIGRHMSEQLGSIATVSSMADSGHAAHLEYPAAFADVVTAWALDAIAGS
jgi:2-succinyl-6-hydroxy-2,4-cyclohexadiene-1-carboxylate synthase